jgi:hypothetical protein
VLGALPANVRVANYVPHRLLLPHVAAMVTNAGYNGVLTALAHGVPLVCAGRTEDKADVSARVAWSGAGLDLGTDLPSTAQVGAAVRRVLTEPSFRANAARIAADFAGHDGPAEAVDLLERLAGEHALIPRGSTEIRPRATPIARKPVTPLDAVTANYRDRGWTVADVRADELGWDLTCTAPDGAVEQVAVKGIDGGASAFLLTRKEERAARREVGWRLAVVTGADGCVRIVDGETVLKHCEPVAYQIDLAGVS